MKAALRFLLFFLPVVGLAIYGSLGVMEKLEKQWLSGDLDRRSQLILNSINDSVADNLVSKNLAPITRLMNRISKDERLTGALVCSLSGELVAKSDSMPKEIGCDKAILASENPEPTFIRLGQTVFHEAILPIKQEDQSLAYFLVVHNTSYMNRRHDTTQKYIIFLLTGLFLCYFIITVLIYRWSVGNTLKRLKSAFKDMVKGDIQPMNKALARSELSPLAHDFSKVVREIRKAKNAVQEKESALLWTSSRLRSQVEKYFGESPLCVIANREPYVHNRKGGTIEVLFPASGLVTAVEPIVRACSGLWIAHGSGSADRETADASGKLLVPPEKPEYALKRVWLSRAEEEGYYYGFSNEGIWPLCHIAHTRPHFDSSDWAEYQKVNDRFAKNFVEENWEKTPIVLIQDYHFALLPRAIREIKNNSILSLFWHIPWPNPEAFGICPWKKEILLGMLGADLIGFHTQFHCNNFLDTVDRFLEARVDREQFSVTIQGHTCYVKPFAISVEWPSRFQIPIENFASEKELLLTELNLPKHVKIGIGVDRVDYTKGLVERLRSVERFLDLHPEWVGKFTFIQIGAPSRTHIKRYQDLNSEVQETVDQINWKFSYTDVPPIILKLSHHNSLDLFRYYRAADLCFVSSLHDGMNLVAKEYISAKEDLNGVLLLSTFAGASRELPDALLINPYSLDECAAALTQALAMPLDEKIQRMEKLRGVVANRNVYGWAGAFLAEIYRISQLSAK